MQLTWSLPRLNSSWPQKRAEYRGNTAKHYIIMLWRLCRQKDHAVQDGCRRSVMREWLRIASEPAVVRRAVKYAIVIGALLIAINHGDAIVRGDTDTMRLFRIGLTDIVPYCVSTSSSVEAIRSLRRHSGAA